VHRQINRLLSRSPQPFSLWINSLLVLRSAYWWQHFNKTAYKCQLKARSYVHTLRDILLISSVTFTSAHLYGRFVRFWASGGAKFTKMCDSLPMKRREKFDATNFILGGEIRNRTNKQTNTHTNSNDYPHLTYRHVWTISRVTVYYPYFSWFSRGWIMIIIVFIHQQFNMVEN